MKILNLIVNEHVTNEAKTRNICERIFLDCDVSHQNMDGFIFDISALENKDYLVFNTGARAVSNPLFRNGLGSLLEAKTGFIYCPPFYCNTSNSHNENYDLSDIAIVSTDTKSEMIQPEISEIFALDGLMLNAEKLRSYMLSNNQGTSVEISNVLHFVRHCITEKDFMFRRAALFVAEKRILLGAQNLIDEQPIHKLEILNTSHEDYLYFFPKLKLDLEEMKVGKHSSGLLALSKYFSGYGTPEISIARKDVITILHYNLIYNLVRQTQKHHHALAVKLAKSFKKEKSIYSVRPELGLIQELLLSKNPALASDLFNSRIDEITAKITNDHNISNILLNTIYDMNQFDELSSQTINSNTFYTPHKKAVHKVTIKSSLRQLLQSIKNSIIYRLNFRTG